MPVSKTKVGLNKLFESGAIVLGDSPTLDIHRVSSGIPQLDTLLGGGYVRKRNIMVVGPESTGKTQLAQYAAAATQREAVYNEVLLVDAEISFDRDWWAGSGVDPAKLYVAQPPSAELAIDLMVQALQDLPKLGLVILDSIAALAPTTVIEKNSGEKVMASLASLVAPMFQKLFSANKNAVVLLINQLRDNFEGYEDVYPGGRSARHGAHVILRTRRQEWLKEKEERVGQIIEVWAKKNKTGLPMGTCEIHFRFKDQLDMVTSYVDEGLERGLIVSAGPYYRMEGNIQILGKAALREYFINTPGALDWLKAAIDGQLQTG